MTRIVIDPITRIGGLLRIEAEIENGVVTDAWSSATMFRGLELTLAGRDPRDSWLLAQRICGSDTGVHALASVRALERALGVAIPTNARLVRNLLAGSQLVVTGRYRGSGTVDVTLTGGIGNDSLLAVSRALPATAADLSGLKELPASLARRHGVEIHQQIVQASAAGKPGVVGRVEIGA